jgi:hypothetical protein
MKKEFDGRDTLAVQIRSATFADCEALSPLNDTFQTIVSRCHEQA